MKLQEVLKIRSNNSCELCKAITDLALYDARPPETPDVDTTILLCAKCEAEIEKKAELDKKHWALLLPETMWSEVPAIQVISWRMLNRLRSDSWASDNLDLMYLDDEKLAWAKAKGDHEGDDTVDLHRDCNGHQLANGDSVLLIKSLDVKGSTLNAKMGTLVKNIRLVTGDTTQIEGKVEGQLIVILTKFVKKQSA